MPAATPVLLNLAMIGARLAAGAACSRAPGIEPIYALAAGVMLGGVLQLAVQVPALRAHRRACRASASAGARSRAAWRHPGVRTHAAPDGAGAARRLGGAALDADQHPDRVAPGRRRGLVADLRRPADGVPDRAARRRARRGADPAALGGAGAAATPPRYSGMLDWGLRLALLLALPCAVGAARLSRARWSRRCSSAASSTRSRVAQDGAARCAATASA